jgi:cardiolipin synthase A/B
MGERPLNSLLAVASRWQEIAGWATLLDSLLVGLTLLSILSIKKDSTSAVAWCMSVLFIPVGGMVLYWLFGYQSVHRPLQRKREHAESYRRRQSSSGEYPVAANAAVVDGSWPDLARLGISLGASPLIKGNRVQLYHEGRPAFDAMLEAIKQARQHVHMEFFIIRADESGKQFIEALAERARAGVKVRLLYDAIGSWGLPRSLFRALEEAGGKAAPFFSLNPLRRRIQINLRNHRKILVVDGKTAFTGGFNIGDEYLGKRPFFGPWRDTFLRLEGPSAHWMQRVFVEDWSFSAGEDLAGPECFPAILPQGNVAAQIAWSGPDQELKTIREIYFAVIAHAKERIWIATPYFVPDISLLDALCLAARSGRDVRLLCPFRPDKWVPFFAARFYWADALAAGVKIYQYTGGFLHAKLLLADDAWCSVGSANFDNRSLHLNFEVTCLMESKEVVAELEAAMLRDMAASIRVNAAEFGQRGFVGRLAENACRLLSPVL